MAKAWHSALALVALVPLGLAGLAAAAPVASGHGSAARPVNLVDVFSIIPVSPDLAAAKAAAATSPTAHVGILPSALRPIAEYRTAPTPTPGPTPAIEPGSVNPAALTAPLAQLAPGPLGIPGIMMHAYKHAADLMATVQPACALPWHLLAGVGKVESGHANGGQADVDGNTSTRILGPVLDGHLAGNAVITDSDGGTLDGDTAYDRAVGPMQFMPGTWATFGADGNNDGVIDPNNVYDAAFAAGRLLCSAGGNLSEVDKTTAAILRYNYSAAYVQNVQAWAKGYATDAYPTESDLPPIGADEKSIDAEPGLKPVPTPDVLPSPEDTPAPPVGERVIELAPGLTIPIPELPIPIPELPCFIDCPAPPD